MRIKKLLLLPAVLLSGLLFATPGELIYDDVVYEAHIKTVQLYRGTNELTYPYLYLRDPTQLTLEFDELITADGDFSDFSVSIKSCDAEWNPSQLMDYEFLDGFSYERIIESTRSVNTRMPYIHYSFNFPTENMKPKVSGNYILYVYRDGDDQDLVLSRRFMVGENKVGIVPETGTSVANFARKRLQTVSFDLYINQLQVFDPFQDIKIKILQNGRWDNASTELKPLIVQDNRLQYTFDAGNEFQGGNEFRMMDIRSTRFLTRTMNSVELLDQYYFIHQFAEKPRLNYQYSGELDMNGNYFIEVMEYRFPDIESDYVMVDFKIKVPSPFGGENVYVYGRMTDWQMQEDFRMVYNAASGQYETEVLLKQGIYNYLYAVGKPGTTGADETRLEGSHYQTENTYTILVYYRGMNDRNDQLVGISNVNYLED